MSNDTTTGRPSRRGVIVSGAAAVAGGRLLLATGAGWAQTTGATGARAGSAEGGHDGPADALPPGESDRDYTPVVTPNGLTLPWKAVDGWKVMHLVAGE